MRPCAALFINKPNTSFEDCSKKATEAGCCTCTCTRFIST